MVVNTNKYQYKQEEAPSKRKTHPFIVVNFILTTNTFRFSHNMIKDYCFLVCAGLYLHMSIYFSEMKPRIKNSYNNILIFWIRISNHNFIIIHVKIHTVNPHQCRLPREAIFPAPTEVCIKRCKHLNDVK